MLGIDGSSVSLTNGASGTTSGNGYGYSVSVSGGTATVTITGTLTPSATQTLVNGLTYRDTGTGAGMTAGERVVTLTSMSDSGGTANGGVDATGLSVSSTVTVSRLNHAPTLSGTAAGGSFTEGGTSASLFSGTSVTVGSGDSGQNLTTLVFTVGGVSDGSSEQMTVDGSSVSLTNGTSGTTTGNGYGYSVSVSGSTATVTVTGTLSTTAMQSLVDGLAYRNTSDDPTAGNRTVTLTGLSDDGGTAGGGVDTASLSVADSAMVVAVNDAPTLTATTQTVTVTSLSSTTALFSGTAIDTIEAGQTITGLRLTVSGLRSGSSEVLVIDGSSVSLIDGASGISASNGISYSVTVTGDTATVSLSKSAGAAVWQSVIDELGYKNTDGTNGLTGDRVVTLTSVSDSGGTANGGVDTKALSISSTVDVSANDTPTVTLPGPATSGSLDQISLSGISVGDSAGGVYVVTLSAGTGQVHVDGATITAGANDSSTVTFSGSLATINSVLASAKYKPAVYGDDTISVAVSDGGSALIGGAKSVAGTIAFTATAPAQPPPSSIPTPPVTVVPPAPDTTNLTPVVTLSNIVSTVGTGGSGFGSLDGGTSSGAGGTSPSGGSSTSGGNAPSGGTVVTAPPVSNPADGGFRVAVVPSSSGDAGSPAVVVDRPIGSIQTTGSVDFTVPVDAFAVTSPDLSVTLSATTADGRPLPSWLSFDARTGTFRGTPPAGVARVAIRLIARDSNGREAVQVFTLEHGTANAGERHGELRQSPEARQAFAGRSGVTEQFVAARHGKLEHLAALSKALRHTTTPTSAG